MDYDKDGSVLRIRGKNILENEHVKVDARLNFTLSIFGSEAFVVSQIGAFHTLELELKRPFVLRKVDVLF